MANSKAQTEHSYIFNLTIKAPSGNKFVLKGKGNEFIDYSPNEFTIPLIATVNSRKTQGITVIFKNSEKLLRIKYADADLDSSGAKLDVKNSEDSFQALWLENICNGDFTIEKN